MKHYKYDKIRRFERAGRGHKPLLDSEQEKLFKYAVGKGYLLEKNDAIRNRKEGLHYEVLRYFDEERLRTKMYAEERRTMREAKLSEVSLGEENEISENKKYTKGTKIREYARVQTGRWTTYQKVLDFKEQRLLFYAVANKYAVYCNDSPRGGKWGWHYEILKYFTTNSLTKKMDAESAAYQKALSAMPYSAFLYDFEIASKFNSIKIDGVYFSNFCKSDCNNRAVVCAIDFDSFLKADIITKRQVYNKEDPLTIVKFDAPKTINVSLSDVDDSAGVKTIDNACGFAIWTRKLKIFTGKEEEQ